MPSAGERARRSVVVTPGRLDFAKRNAGFGYLSTIATLVVGFVSRTVFINTLGSGYLGVNALLLNVLGVLSFMELGLGSALNYSLYKPLAEGDESKVRSLARFYRTTYRYIALAVTVVGLAAMPFIPLIAGGAEGLGDLRLYFALFLASNVMSYFAVYKTGIANAEQRSYLITNIHTIASVATSLVQIAVLLHWKSYLAYLLVMLASRAAEQVVLNLYLSKRYSRFLAEPEERLDATELAPIKRNIKALVWHRLGEISVHQTDSIIIAAFINVTMVGLISNYNLIINTGTLFLSVAMNSVTGSFGNAIATATPDSVYRNFRVFRFIAFWLYGLTAIGMFALLTPVIVLWIGPSMVIGDEVVFLIMLNYYMVGHRATINTVKSAAGIWAPDKYLALAQAVINLVVSILLVRLIGVAGVFIGTIAQGVVATVIKPFIVYPRVFQVRVREYFFDGAKYFAVVVVAGACAKLTVVHWTPATTWWGMFAAVALVFVVTNAAFYLVFRGTPEWRVVRTRVLNLPPRRMD